MIHEGIKASENEKKTKKLTEEEKKAEVEKQIKFIEKKKKIEVRENTGELLSELKELVTKGVIDEKVAQKISSGEKISDKEVKEMFEKIKQISEIKDITRYIPQNLIVSPQEYLKAFQDKKTRDQVLSKLKNILNIVSDQIIGSSGMSMSLFSSFLHVLDKNLILIQENTIDLRNTLAKVEKK